MRQNILLAFVFSFVFFVAGVVTLSHYGISWDEPEHFFRGQGYLRLFLAGKKDFNDLKPYNLDLARSDPNYHERSYYQHDSYNAQVWFVTDKGHPPLNDVLAAFFNYIFYQKLGLAGDIQGYHLFNVFISAVLLGTVFFFAAQTFGLWSGIFSAVFMSTYPLFWAESHFNIKDPAQASFLLLALYFFWKAVYEKKLKFIFLGALFSGFSLSVKFNVLFLPFIVGPWLLLVLVKGKNVKKFLLAKNAVISIAAIPFIMLGILIISWPFLWQDVFGNLISVFTYYKELGTEEGFNLNPVASWNFYALSWILYTTPPITLLFFILGIFSFKNYWQRNNNILILWLLLFVVPVARVSFPNTSIYGGVRQIMEYIPAMALIAGVGASHIAGLIQRLNTKLNFKLYFLILIFAFLIYPIIRLHPNENVYFNSLIGGLPGAKEKNIPSWGNSYGNAYWQAIEWLNKNADKNFRVALIQGTSLNIMTAKLRPDIDFSNSYWSGIYRDGEYLVELTHQSKKLYPYAWDYVERLLSPVYEIKVDNVAIAKIWKNDLSHTKSEFQRKEVIYNFPIGQKITNGEIILELGRNLTLARLVIFYDKENCEFSETFVTTSLNGKEWVNEKESMPVQQVLYREDKDSTKEPFFFSATLAQFIKLTSFPESCLFVGNPSFRLYTLGD